MSPVIDFHTHIGCYDAYAPWVQELYIKNLGPNAKEKLDQLLTPINYSVYLEACGVDYACCLAEENPKTTGIIPNEWVTEFCKDQPRLIPFCNINPFMHANPADAFAHCVKTLGMRGLKLMPGYQGYHANDRMMYPIYARAEEWQIPVLVHTGSSIFNGFRLRYANPLDLDDVAIDFPKLTIVMAHSGRGVWYDEAFFLARLRENVYMEIAGLPPQKLLDYFPDLERLADKVIFGSDYPGGPDIKKNMDAVRALPLKELTKEKILGANAARILSVQ